MKIKNFLTLLVALSVFLIHSCTVREDIPTENTLSDKAQKVNLVSNKITNDANSRVYVIIFSVNLGRASQGFLRSWGFCNFQWFPLVAGEPVPQDQLLVEQLETVDHQKYFEVQSNSAVPSDATSQELDLIVDANMSTLVNAETVTLKMGTYHYDYSIGQYKVRQLELKRVVNHNIEGILVLSTKLQQLTDPLQIYSKIFFSNTFFH